MRKRRPVVKYLPKIAKLSLDFLKLKSLTNSKALSILEGFLFVHYLYMIFGFKAVLVRLKFT